MFDDLVLIDNGAMGTIDLDFQVKCEDENNNDILPNLELSPVKQTRRRTICSRRKNKRNLKLTGDSPYLEYLPDLLKKVDKPSTMKRII